MAPLRCASLLDGSPSSYLQSERHCGIPWEGRSPGRQWPNGSTCCQSDGGRKELFGVLILAQDHIGNMERVTVIQKVVKRVTGNRGSTKSHDYPSFPSTRPTIGISIVRGIQPFCEPGPSRMQVQTSHRLSGIITPKRSPILFLSRSARAMS